ncbi:hypothetical protein FA95DRAFT_1679141 [Auriscalpium vulgare]|uniref:Uncharacterized protein n=1 Tax=Auriscalpium vulgare TaxID=40419 RepID=A0ACB8RT42_9AGAM|nr:hypothetical protein FA95DRAFT_1679141 [Auriscalpium vulgare]
MSFSFEWPRFSDQFHADAIQMLNSALNKGPKPPVIADKIEVVELEMGTQPPELEIRDIGDLTTDQFRGIFRLTYAGDAHLVLKTKVQANPLNHKQPDIHLMTGTRGMLAAKHALVVPMLLRLSHFRLSSYVVLVVSKQKGITLVFKTDPLQNVDINSTFDSIAVIQSFIQREIEGQLRQMFREDLPGIIHRLSQQWVKAKVEAPYLPKQPIYPASPMSVSTQSPHHLQPPSVAGPPRPVVYRRARTSSDHSFASTSRTRRTASAHHPTPSPAPDPPESTFPDIENFDPTYGLRPEGIPAKSVFRAFGSLFAAPGRGLADLAEEAEATKDGEFEEGTSYDVVDWEDTVPGLSPEPSVEGSVVGEEDPSVEYETLPAVGGGTVTRPRVFHSLSQIHPPAGVASPLRTPSVASTSKLTPAALDSLPRADPRSLLASTVPTPRRPQSQYNPYFPTMGLPPPYAPLSGAAMSQGHRHAHSTPPTPPLYHSPPTRPVSPSSLHTHPSRSSSHTHSVPTPPSTDLLTASPNRRPTLSYSDRLDSFAHPPGSPPLDPLEKIVLRPTLNNSISQLSSLSHSNHTLSPYTRAPEHFTVRSVPRVPPPVPPKAAVRARRRRTHVLARLGAKKEPSPVRAASGDEGDVVESRAATPPSEFDAEDMDRYFRAQDEYDYASEHGRFALPHSQSYHARPPEGNDIVNRPTDLPSSLSPTKMWDVLCLLCAIRHGGGPDALLFAHDIDQTVRTMSENMSINLPSDEITGALVDALRLAVVHGELAYPERLDWFPDGEWPGFDRSIAIGHFDEDGPELRRYDQATGVSLCRNGKEVQVRLVEVYSATMSGIFQTLGVDGEEEEKGIDEDGGEEEEGIDEDDTIAAEAPNFAVHEGCYRCLQAWLRVSGRPRNGLSFAGEFYELVNSGQHQIDSHTGLLPGLRYSTGMRKTLNQFQDTVLGTMQPGATHTSHALKAGLRGQDLMPAIVEDFKGWRFMRPDIWPEPPSQIPSIFTLYAVEPSDLLQQPILLRLPHELFLIIVDHLHLAGFMALSATSKSVRAVLSSPHVVNRFFRSKVVSPHGRLHWILPLPSVPNEVERCHSTAAKWISSEDPRNVTGAHGPFGSPDFPYGPFVRACLEESFDSMRNRERIWGMVKKVEKMWRGYRKHGYKVDRFFHD